MTMIRFASILLALGLAASGCTETVAACTDPTHVRYADGTCGPPDGGPGVDASLDAGADVGADVCGGCAGTLASCRTSDMRCVECLDDDDCGIDMCDTGPGECVECMSSTDCSDPGAPTCTPDGECAAGCTDLLCATNFNPGSPACDEDSGRCVACTPDSEADDCGGFSCDPTMLECTMTMRGSLLACQDCVSDTECSTLTVASTTVAMRCVPGGWGTGFAEPTGMHCLPDFDEIDRTAMPFCPNGFPEIRTLTSVGGVTARYCHPPAQTTCPAMNSLRLRGTMGCTVGTVDDDCGIPGVADAVCPDTRCSVPCMTEGAQGECVQGRCMGGACI